MWIILVFAVDRPPYFFRSKCGCERCATKGVTPDLRTFSRINFSLLRVVGLLELTLVAPGPMPFTFFLTPLFGNIIIQ